jgi:hypothetical protein
MVVMKDEVEVGTMETYHQSINRLDYRRQTNKQPSLRTTTSSLSPFQPLLPSYLPNICQGAVAYVHYFKFLQHLVGGKSVASVELSQVKPR